ncbi:MAG TPA: hypothetical protein VJS11_03780 [Acidobacteriaceae bacterium]|nr:hypothetical protein [Acidobacteriaceae bacterium]
MKNLSRRLTILLALLASTSLALAQDRDQPEGQGGQDKLVQVVRQATQRYLNVANAAPDYGPALGCVSGPDHGAMGVHYVNGNLVNGETLLPNGQLDPTKPQALIYEPQPNGEMRLVGVEYIILASALPAGAAPQVADHLMVYVATPNRYGLPGFFEMHVWAWKDNPQSPFADWNDHVTCAHQ